MAQRVQGTYIVECRVSILGNTIMIWGGIPRNMYVGPFGEVFAPSSACSSYAHAGSP